MNCRFTSYVFPGETLLVEAWIVNSNKAIYRTSTIERGKIVIKGEITYDS